MNDEPLSILIADESERCREALRDTLEPEGYDIVGARSGREAINVVRQVCIHVVVMDVRLPDYSGLEIYHAIKSILGASLPCIFTAMEMSADSILAEAGRHAAARPRRRLVRRTTLFGPEAPAGIRPGTLPPAVSVSEDRCVLCLRDCPLASAGERGGGCVLFC